MAVKCIQTAGSEACPDGHYALYEHANYNRPKPGKASPTRGQTVIADESVPSLNGYHSHADLTTSVVNKTGRDLELFIDGEFRGESMTVGAGQSIDQLPPPFDNAISSSRLTQTPAPAGSGGVQGVVGGLRDKTYQVTGGKVTEPGKAEAGSDGIGMLRDWAFEAFGGEIEKPGHSQKLPDCVARVIGGELSNGNAHAYTYSENNYMGGYQLNRVATFSAGMCLFTFRKSVNGWFTYKKTDGGIPYWLKEAFQMPYSQHKYFYVVDKDGENPNGRTGELWIDGGEILFCDRAQMKDKCRNPNGPWNADKDR
ncbi:peptidase inhibitor family I36 protein [Streptomyces syringium]|uniref:peptidase inhibitor family I36 protein n=1 Tax=Streptomyces syringium TaxID=76729 RepID=UPI003669EF1E